MSAQLESFLTPELKSLLVDGDKLINITSDHQPYGVKAEFTDYSFLVFQFAKAYEGFLKLLFLRTKIIRRQEYESDYWRVGRALSPNMHQTYDRLITRFSNGPELAEKLWQTWRRGRNTVFHFYPHRLKIVTLQEAQDIIAEILMTMELSLQNCQVR